MSWLNERNEIGQRIQVDALSRKSERAAEPAVPRLELPALEPFPFVPDPPQPARAPAAAVSPKLRPKKFVPAEARESDYESDYDAVKIRPKWTPAGVQLPADQEPQYRLVQAPTTKGHPQQRFRFYSSF